MFHIVGVTPEAPTLDAVTIRREPERRVRVDAAALARTWEGLNSATVASHRNGRPRQPALPLTEFARLADLCDGRTKSPDVELIVTTSRSTYARAEQAGLRRPPRAVRRPPGQRHLLVPDRRAGGPAVVPDDHHKLRQVRHYGTAAVGRGFHLRSLAGCVDAACTGDAGSSLPAWLGERHRAR